MHTMPALLALLAMAPSMQLTQRWCRCHRNGLEPRFDDLSRPPACCGCCAAQGAQQREGPLFLKMEQRDRLVGVRRAA